MNLDQILHSITFVLLFFLTVSSGSVMADELLQDGAVPVIDLITSKQVVEIGDSIELEGFIDPSFLNYPGDRIMIKAVSPRGSRNDVFNFARVQNDGTFSLQLPADVMGDWLFSPYYGDYSGEPLALKVTPRAKVKETEITVSGPFIRPLVGDKAKMAGWLRDDEGVGIPDRQVWYEFGLPSYSCRLCDEDSRRIWQTLRPVTSDSLGYFEFTFPVSDNGEYAIRATFPGDEIYGKSESEIKYVPV